MLSRWGFALALCAVAACTSKPRRTAGTPPSSSAAQARAAAPNPDAGPDAVLRGFDAGVARSFIDRWLQAQNEHDFAAYSELYASRFSGTKRVGSYSKHFDRGSWLRDRQAMFRDGVVVHISGLQLAGSAGAVRAVFTQDFVAPGFHDTGTKELFLVAQPSGFAISREELLLSQLAQAAPAADSTVMGFHRDGPVLARGLTGALGGTPQLLARGASGSYDVALPVVPAAVREATRAWLGKSVTVYALDGAACQGVVTRFEARVKAEPHFGMRQAWDGEGGLPKSTPTQIAEEIWGTARYDERFVVGVLDQPCHGVWAVSKASSFIKASAPSQPLRAQALTAFEALPAYRQLQARFAQESSHSEQPWQSVDGALRVVEVRAQPDSALLVVAARGGVGCGGFGGNLSAIWRVSGAGSDPKLTLRGVFKDSTDMLQVNGAIDQNADGTLELLAGPAVFADEVSVLRLAPSGYVRDVLFSTSVWDCGC
jgi:hypothetical protein